MFVTLRSGSLESERVHVTLNVGTKVLVAVMVGLWVKVICIGRVSVPDIVGDWEIESEIDFNGVCDMVCPRYREDENETVVDGLRVHVFVGAIVVDWERVSMKDVV